MSIERHGLAGGRLRLEPTSAHHAVKVFDSISDERLWTFFPSLRPTTIEDLRALYRRWQRGNPYANKDEVWENWVCFLADTETPVGGLQATLLPGNVANIAYVTYFDHQRKGYAHEGAQMVIDHLREVHGIERVVADMSVHNEASIKVVESLGFVRQATNGDQYVYELTWSATK